MPGTAEIVTANTLVFAWGNPSRGDDAIGPVFIQFIDEFKPAGVDSLCEYQLQIEHSLDLLNRPRVLFVDAAYSGKTPYVFQRIQAQQDQSFTSHALSPQALLATYQSVYKQAAPPSFLLSIRGYAFELGEALSDRAEHNLAEARRFTQHSLFREDGPDWSEFAE